MTDVDDGPVPLRIPAILQNPTNKSQRQVEAFNAQQREKAIARKEASKTAGQDPLTSKRGKRVVRRMNNAAHVDNPHAVAPKRGDMAPAVPLHHHPLRPAFPPTAIERSTPVAPVDANRSDPLGPSSVHGAFSTSLKGTRAMLRRRGRRAERLVPTVEDAVRSWLGGEFDCETEDAWRTIDATEVDYASAIRPEGQANGGGPSRRMPQQHHMREAVPDLPIVKGQVAAVLELSRSPAHMSWAVPDSFDRLVVHLVARYYELISWSEDQRTATGQVVRLTHIVRPNIARPKAPPPSHALLTPETSDVSGVSGSDTEHGTTEGETEGESSDAATEMAHSDTESVDGYDADTTIVQHPGDASVETAVSEPLSLSERWADEDTDGSGNETPHQSLTERFGGLDLHRTTSHGSSAYASSEGGWTDVGADSTLLHRNGDEWQLESPVLGKAALPQLKGGAPQRLGGNADWSDKPSFFEYLFGD